MEESNIQPNYFAIIPANVRYDSELTDKAKLLYGEITCLSNKEGYCFASNRYFAKLYNCSTRAIQDTISKLQKRGYISVVIEERYKRKIFISQARGHEKNFVGRYENNFTNNNININKIDRLFNYIINKEQKIPTEFQNIQSKDIFDILKKYDMLYTKEIIQNIQSDENIDKIKYIVYVLALIVKEERQVQANNITRVDLINVYDNCKGKNDETRYK